MAEQKKYMLYGKVAQVKVDETVPEAKAVMDKARAMQKEDCKPDTEKTIFLTIQDKIVLARNQRAAYYWRAVRVPDSEVPAYKAKGFVIDKPKDFKRGERAPGTPKPDEIPTFVVPEAPLEILKDERAEPVTAKSGK